MQLQVSQSYLETWTSMLDKHAWINDDKSIVMVGVDGVPKLASNFGGWTFL